MSKRIVITYGSYKPGYGFGAASQAGTTDRKHLVELEAWNRDTVCGLSIWGEPTEYTSGTLCPNCAKALGIRWATDLDVDEETARWMAVQHAVETVEEGE